MSETTEVDWCVECGYEFEGDGPVQCSECSERLREPIHRYYRLEQVDDQGNRNSSSQSSASHSTVWVESLL